VVQDITGSGVGLNPATTPLQPATALLQRLYILDST